MKDVDALVICTEWKHFWAPDLHVLLEKMKRPVVIDGRNLYDPMRMAKAGFDYLAVGRRGTLCNQELEVRQSEETLVAVG